MNAMKNPVKHFVRHSIRHSIKQRKGQISFAEYLVAIVVFLTFVGYFSFQLLNFLPAYLTQIRSERVRGEAYQMSELLINDPGYKIDWDKKLPGEEPKRIGLSDEIKNVTNFISIGKISQLQAQCAGSGYSNVKKWLGSDLDFSISITVINSDTGLPEQYYSCRPQNPLVRTINTTIKRFAAVDSNHFAEIIMQVV